jgi:hypothetical protein
MTIQAFPSGHNPKTGMIDYGMTLRDYFAAKAMQTILSNRGMSCPDDVVSVDAYQLADEMMRARDK